MRSQRRSRSAYDGLSEALHAFIARRAQELTGLSLIALTALVAASLATWSVDDPSLNNATDAPVRNLIGWPGAIVADILMQLFGLGSVAAIGPVALWGWRLARRGYLGRVQLRLALWINGAGAATAVASALPVTDRWPLPPPQPTPPPWPLRRSLAPTLAPASKRSCASESSTARSPPRSPCPGPEGQSQACRSASPRSTPA